MVKSGVYGDGSAYDNGYPSQMIIRDDERARQRQLFPSGRPGSGE